MFDIVVVALLVGLTLLAITRFPAEGGGPRVRLRAERPETPDVCPACRASLRASDHSCLTCGTSVGHELQTDPVIR